MDASYEKKDYIQKELFELDKNNIYWSIDKLMSLYGYRSKEDFLLVINKAKETCKIAGINISEHFGFNDDIKLTRYGAYLVAIRGNSDFEEIIYARMYFAVNLKGLYL